MSNLLRVDNKKLIKKFKIEFISYLFSHQSTRYMTDLVCDRHQVAERIFVLHYLKLIFFVELLQCQYVDQVLIKNGIKKSPKIHKIERMADSDYSISI